MRIKYSFGKYWFYSYEEANMHEIIKYDYTLPFSTGLFYIKSPSPLSGNA